MTLQIALNFEDGVTRFIECRPNEMVADASYRQRINIPLDCRDGACGTCKSFCESGSYDGGDYIEDALTDEEADAGLRAHLPDGAGVGPRPAHPGLVGRRKTSIATHSGEVTARSSGCPTRRSRSASSWTNPSALGFLPGQYVNILVPGTDQTRSYSFSSGPGRDEVELPGPQHPARRDEHLPARPRKPGDRIEFTGPLGSFYLREHQAPGAVPRRRHRPRAVPVDAGQDRGGRAARSTRST